MSLRRKIADAVRHLADRIERGSLAPLNDVLVGLPMRRVNPSTGLVEYFDEARCRWVYWRNWSARP